MIAEGAQAPEWIDPRIRRTRHMLHQSLEHLLETKSFEKISVGEIAEDATLNRATFYDHYPDKFALLEGMVSSRFQELLERRGVVFDGTCSYAIKRIILAMCDYLAGLPGMTCPERRHIDKHFESALMQVVRTMLLSGLQNIPFADSLSPELVAAMVSGAMYGGVNEWVRTPDRCPAEQMADSIFTLIYPMLHPGAAPPGETNYSPS